MSKSHAKRVWGPTKSLRMGFRQYLYYRKYIGRLKQNSPSVNILSLEAAHTLSPFSTTQTYTCTPEHNEYMCGM